MSEFIRHPSGRRFTASEFRREIVARAACPLCGSGIGELCIHPATGRRRLANHAERIEAVTGQTHQEAVVKMRNQSASTYRRTKKRRPMQRGWV